MLEIGEGSFRTTMPLTLPGAAAGLTMRGTILYAGPAGQAALTLGDGGTARNANASSYSGLRRAPRRAERLAGRGRYRHPASATSMPAVVEIRQAERFTIGVRTIGDARGFEDSDLRYGRIVNNRIGLDLRTADGRRPGTPRCATMAATSPWLQRDQYRQGPLRHRLLGRARRLCRAQRALFVGPAFELQRQGTPASVGIPFLCEVDGRGRDRHAASGWRPARPSSRAIPAASQDHATRSPGRQPGLPGATVDYAATRRGSAARCAAAPGGAAREATPRRSPRRRTCAPRPSAGTRRETGFEQLACLSGNVVGHAGDAGGFAFPALDGYSLTDRGVLLTGGRGARLRGGCAALQGVRPGAGCGRAAARGDVLRRGREPADRRGRRCWFSRPASRMQWNADARWWQGAADIDDAGADAAAGGARWRRRSPMPSSACARHVRGLRGARDAPGSATRARRRRCCSACRTCRTARGSWRPNWPGTRPRSRPARTAQINVAAARRAAGRFRAGGFALAASGVVFLGAGRRARTSVTVTAWNRSGGAIDLGAGTVRVRVVKP